MRPGAAILILSLVCGALACGHGSHDDRVKYLTEVVENDPANVTARRELARACLEHGDWELALAELDRADAMIPAGSRMDFSVTRARALMTGGRNDEARRVLDSFLEKSPDHAAALLERARVMDSLGNPALCLADYRKALEVTVNPEPDLFIEVADQLVKQNLTAEAIRVMSKSIESKGQVPSLVLKAMDLEMAAGRYDDALKRIDTMAAVMPRPEPWMAKRAGVLSRAGRTDESKLEWQALLDHIDSLPDAERRSAAMTNLAAEARDGLKSR
jgi:tetratricopeptide (TPR) repeat protein